jgi:formylglycine-generating enzyme required for sulfatase activity
MLCGRLNAALSGEIAEVKLNDLVSMKFVQIPAGTFIMGSPKSEESRLNNEDQHEVTISQPFYLGIHEVTQEQYWAVMDNNPSNFTANGGARPVETVSWDDAIEFCRKASALTGKRLRLPTEAEWEYACRAGTATPFNTGETISTDQANYNGDAYGWMAKGGCRRETTEAGSFPPNAWGLYDMHGNVWEWCSDWYGDYAAERQTDPQGAAKGTDRVLRGGNWYFIAEYCRSARRYWLGPASRIDFNGFRVVLD